MPKASLARVLVLESDKDLLRSWSIKLQANGYLVERFECVDNAYQAAGLARRSGRPFDVFVVDFDCVQRGDCDMGPVALVINLRLFHRDAPFLCFSSRLYRLPEKDMHLPEPCTVLLRDPEDIDDFSVYLTSRLAHVLSVLPPTN